MQAITNFCFIVFGRLAKCWSTGRNRFEKVEVRGSGKILQQIERINHQRKSEGKPILQSTGRGFNRRNHHRDY